MVSILFCSLAILLISRYSNNLALALCITFVAGLYLFARTQIRARESVEAALAQLQTAPPVSNDTAFRIAQSEALQEKLRAAEALHHSLVQTLPFFIFRKDLDGKFTFANDRFCNHVGLSQEKILGKIDAELFGKELAAKYTHDDMLVRQSESSLDVIETHQTADGSLQYVHVLKSPLYDSEGVVSGVQGVFWDVTERRRAEERLAAEKERLTVTLRSIGDGVISTDIDGKITLMNQVAEELTGWTQGEAKGKPIKEVFKCVDPRNRGVVTNPVANVLETGHRTEPGHRCLLISRLNKEFLIEDRAASMRDRQRQIIGAVLVFQDITARLQLEAEAAKASRIESIGFLAGGIAHDFNNILTAILGNLSLAKFTGKLTPEVIARLDLVEKASLRARELTQQLLTFARGGAPVKQTASLIELIRESTGFALRGSRLRAEYDIDKDLAPAEVDSGQIHQVIHNLVLNAVQAMPQGGTIRVSAKNHRVISRVEVPLAPGDYVRISVRDEGPGIPSDLLPKIFDPYFTTKRGGTGLGLATAFSIIKRHEGILTVESTYGDGAVFHLYLPASPNAVPVEPADTPANFKGSGRILVMDDEEPVRNLVSAMLQHFGYRTEAVKDGAEAIIRYGQAKRIGEPFTAVIMDLTIPGGMGGREALQQLRQQDPNIRAIVSSGYCNDPVMAKHREHGFAGVVEKPYTIEELGRVLHEVVHPKQS